MIVQANYIVKILIIGLFLQLMSMSRESVAITTEAQLVEIYNTEINQFWQSGTFSSFAGVNQADIHYAQFQSSNNQHCVIIVPGRTESYLKYQELSFDLFNLGYNILIVDHRGQGLSSRLTKNPHQGYVENFTDYSQDLATLITDTASDLCTGKQFLLAHSMGGAIAADFLNSYQHNISAAVFSSPMLGINSGGLPKWLATTIVTSGNWLNHQLSDDPWYFFGQKNFKANGFINNPLTHSKIRFDIFDQLYQEQPNIQLGGVTFQWLQQAIDATNKLLAKPLNIKTPSIILQAGNDTVVDNQAQVTFCRALHQANNKSCPSNYPIVIEGANHEILFEQDAFRQPAMKKITDWFRRHH